MNDEQRFRIYRGIARRVVWERRSVVALWCTAAFMAGFGVGWMAAPR